MYRDINKALEDWKSDQSRKVLLLRGARQVGKTYSIREFGKTFKYFLEVNFELERKIHHFFSGNLNPDAICMNLSAYYGVPIIGGETLIFFDEIQACVPALSSLRFFHENRPGLHVAAAGSLLEFALEELPSFGLGRIEHLFMFPMSFNEFLFAAGSKELLELKSNSTPDKPLNQALHQKLTGLLKEFLFIGGLPEAVGSYLQTKDLRKTSRILDQFLNSLMLDLSKYKAKVPVTRLKEVFYSAVAQSGGKFNVSRASRSSSNPQIIQCIELLEMAGLIHRVYNTPASGLPLKSHYDNSRFKIVMFDHGIFQRILGLEVSDYLFADTFSAINKGNVAEQFTGTEILKYHDPQSRQDLLYWQREKTGSSSEVDYILQKGRSVIPVEVKSGMQGKMQSLRLFLHEKHIKSGIRVSLENFSMYDDISVYPLYAISELLRQPAMAP